MAKASVTSGNAGHAMTLAGPPTAICWLGEPRGLRPHGLPVVMSEQTLHDNHTTRPTAFVEIRIIENIFVRGGLCTTKPPNDIMCDDEEAC